MAVLEIGRSNFSTPFLKQLAGGLDYEWSCLPPNGRSGGIIVGFNSAQLSVQSVVARDFCVKFKLKSKEDGFLWLLVIVYGAAQEEHKPAFLAELVRICQNETLPMLVGGDSNIIRR